MKITIESTPELTIVDGLQVRVWKGTTQSNVSCVVLVRQIAVLEGKDQEFARELQETQSPAEAEGPLRVIPFRQVLEAAVEEGDNRD